MTEIRVGGYAPASSVHGRSLQLFADRIEATTDLSVDVMHNILDIGRPATDLLSMTEAGELFMCFFSTSYLGSRIPLLNVLEVPFLFDDLPSAHSALDGDLGAAMTAATEEATGFTVLGYWDNGFRHFTNRLRPVLVPGDVAGMTVRLQPNALHEAMVTSWGGTPMAVELSKGIAMIQALEVDAQENPMANTVAYGVDKVHGHVTMTSHLYGGRGLYANAEALAGLDTETADAVRVAARDAIEYQRESAAIGEREIRERLEGDGIEFVDLDVSERRRFKDAAAPAIQLARETLDPAILTLAGL